jgi:Flp pilus assembly pilin Flp
MKARVITTEYTADPFAVQPWQRITDTASQGPATADESAPAVVPAAARKSADRGASAVEWVVITGIVVAIVAGVGWGISKAISSKADDACNKINNAGGNLNVTGGADAQDKTGGSGCSGSK